MFCACQMGKLMRDVVWERQNAVIEGRIEMLRRLVKGCVNGLKRK